MGREIKINPSFRPFISQDCMGMQWKARWGASKWLQDGQAPSMSVMADPSSNKVRWAPASSIAITQALKATPQSEATLGWISAQRADSIQRAESRQCTCGYTACIQTHIRLSHDSAAMCAGKKNNVSRVSRALQISQIPSLPDHDRRLRHASCH